MFNEDGWHIALRSYFTHHALKREQAEECVTQVFLRYSTKRDALQWSIGAPPPLLWKLARDVLCEHFRQQAREKQRLEKLQCVLACDAETCVEMLAIDELDAERFANSLPERLREVLELRLQGCTCVEIAQQMSLSPGTVKAYLAELRKKFVKYYGCQSRTTVQVQRRKCMVLYVRPRAIPALEVPAVLRKSTMLHSCMLPVVVRLVL